MALTAHKQAIADGNIGMEKDFMLHYNLSVQAAQIYGRGGQRLGFNSSMGGQQGCAMLTRTQCLHLQSMMDEINEDIQHQEQRAEMPNRQLQGLIPDFKFQLAAEPNGTPGRQVLGELKAVGTSRITRAQKGLLRGLRSMGLPRQRANALDGEYLRKAKKLDQKFNNVKFDEVGPVEEHLRSFQHRGQLVQRLVFGAFGDASQGSDVLVQDTATTGARKHWRKMQCKSPTEAFGSSSGRSRSCWGSR
jgi:hypothetical protein